ncbi:hypothetical protein DFH07DRAFT_1063080 [Mycena maculata]|uniref:Uncharacterized protein n=1 Tax=Mycena maculata TaxID=230809 RepID=A0AAD7IN51_9AGAR|nr:hypothetical protein DFH07DRAFT_1063080 [Mycena maculata]
MTQVPPVVLILGELFIAFSTSSLIVLAILRLAAPHFPLLVAVQITFVYTLIVFAALRACGLWSFVYPASEPDFHQPDEKRTLCAEPCGPAGMASSQFKAKASDEGLCTMV